ncbi:ketoacyl-ACP synthase III [Paraburkholderia sp. CNPSo 3076]|uniref:3-oxoacyl-ACP synthase III family protein n=1 Tax=Paraburkholderia sp. CNPSo 3076 TaxID=2940936 RepID=UPI002259F6F9|nr:ketoacyl-ACP synthase III [Paraburkholderia sp. CNPSo 3076]MCX5541456.1 ketoacyl-ACP synthase III [Paraburkholderia sp. CNPSo 3076]
MNLLFESKRIAALLTVVPANEQSFIDDMKAFDFPEARSRKLMEVMGYDRHRLVSPGTCVSDLAVFGFEHLFDKHGLERDSLDALILVTQTPDYLMPPTSSIIQGRLGLKQDMFCVDINQGCAGFVIGLMQAFMLLDQKHIQRVALVNADVISRKTSPRDRNSYPLVGDAASITVVEKASAAGTTHANVKFDGTRHGALMIPAGGMRMPSSAATAELSDAGDHNFRALDHLTMEGSDVFTFVQTEVPPMIASLCDDAGVSKEQIEWFLFHQPNRFMLQKLADKIGIPHAKVPMNVVEKYGNSSGVTIPMAIVENLSEVLNDREALVCLAGFGVGLTWASMLMRLGRLDVCEMVQYA